MFYSKFLLIIILIIIYFCVRFYSRKNFFLFYLLTLLITPWAWILLTGEPPFAHLINLPLEKTNIIELFEIIFSYKYMFFEGYPGIFHIVGNHGYFLPSFIPLIIVGIWVSISSPLKLYRRLIFLLPILLIFSILFTFVVGLISIFVFVPLLSFFATIGLIKYLDEITKGDNSVLKALIISNIILIIYESVRLMRVLQIQYGLLNQ